LSEIKEAINNGEELIKLFYIIEDETIVDETELGKILTACQNIGVPFGITMYDILSGKVDPDLAIALDAKMWIDEEIINLPYAPKKKKKESKFEKENKIVMFKDKNKKDDKDNK